MKQIDEIKMKIKFYSLGILIVGCFFEINLDGQVLKEAANKIDTVGQSDSMNSNRSAKIQLSDTIFEVKAGAILNVGITDVIIGGFLKKKDLSDIISVGLCLSTRPRPVLTDYKVTGHLDSVSFICKPDNLSPSTLYFVRAFATTRKDTVYSPQKIFYTHKREAIADIDGNYYNTVQIGTQLWFTEDLKTTRFNDGQPIGIAAEMDKWAWRKTPGWCWYANDSVIYSFPRGKLYNWHAVGTGKLCPTGWHIPSDTEWNILQTSLGGDSIAGGKLKTTGTIFWRNPNVKATNESGFSSIPAGYRSGTGKFLYSTMVNYWWSSNEIPPEAASIWHVYHAQGKLYHESSFKMFGYSVRCLKDQHVP